MFKIIENDKDVVREGVLSLRYSALHIWLKHIKEKEPFKPDINRIRFETFYHRLECLFYDFNERMQVEDIKELIKVGLNIVDDVEKYAIDYKEYLLEGRIDKGKATYKYDEDTINDYIVRVKEIRRMLNSHK